VERDVDFSFSPEHDELRSMVRKLFSSSSTDAPKETWTQLAELGLIGLAVPTEHGGSGGGFIDLGILMEEAGRSLSALHCSPMPFWPRPRSWPPTTMRSAPRSCPHWRTGSLIAGVTLNTHGRMESQEAVTATRSGGGWRLAGTAPLVLDGASADVLVLPVRSGNSTEVFLAETNGAGVTRGRHDNLDPSRALAHVELDDVPARRLDGPAAGRQSSPDWLT
jgi:alkylation response protein AidB-like acyl-CoA dehydrogenase